MHGWPETGKSEIKMINSATVRRKMIKKLPEPMVDMELIKVLLFFADREMCCE